ncbi:3-oxoacyl-ACP reductase [Kinneretia asaccharophila]|uniref:3-oxoacyl-ACP reductase n=1 Tax=Roseateles asaccharophilus TaxID=582607 RepID=UPI0025B4A9AC|nr:3-oxoacyl-ACP reductase [Roseateles asaccharophilus]MDN3544409.1 3-oxoacyl-ACP reductase [Roseateles asaccharophilus]
MTDRLLSLAQQRWSAPLLRALGLPQPQPLRRRATVAWQRQELAGRRLRLLAAAPSALAPRLQAWAEACGLVLSGGDESAQALLLDLSAASRLDELLALRALAQPAVSGLARGGRVLLLAPPLDAAAGPEAAAVAAALRGFVRALGKELGRRGASANLLALDAGADPAALEAALDFFLGDGGAYVSGQVLNLPSAVAGAGESLQGALAVVTGAAGGIGAATVRRLAAEGVRLLCVDVPAAAAPLQALAAAVGGEALGLDITSPAGVAQLAQVVAARGGASLLVHNAGITRDRSLARMSAAEWDSVLAVNLGAVLAIDAALDAAAALRPGAREICLASISGIAGNAGQTNYAASKAGLIGHVQARGLALARRGGGGAFAVAPGFIETAMTRRMPWMLREAGRRLNALKQGGQPEDVAEAIAFLARPEAAAFSGQTLRVCGQSLLGA